MIDFSQKNGAIPFLVYYTANNGEDSASQLKANFTNAAFMDIYYENLRVAASQAFHVAGKQMVCFILEPDAFGYMQQSGFNPAVQVQAAYDHGGS